MFKNFIERVQQFIDESKYSGMVISAGIFLFIVLISFSRPYELFELTLYDLRFKIKPALQQWEYLTFLNLDDNSIEQIGKYPWPRDVYATGLSTLKNVGARAVAFDVEFPNESPVKINAAEMKKARAKGSIDVRDIDKVIINNDKLFVDAIKQYKEVILAYSFANEKLKDRDIDHERLNYVKRARENFVQRASVKLTDKQIKEFSGLNDPSRKGILYPIPELIGSTRAFGFVDSDFDIDGVSRQIRMVRVFEGRAYFHMSLMMTMHICKVPKEKVLIQPGTAIILKDAVHPFTHQKGDLRIPIDEKGMLYINWAGAFHEAFNHVSYYALIEYPQIKDAVYELFKQIEEQEVNQAGVSKRIRLAAELEEAHEKFTNAKNADEKQKWWNTVNRLKKEIYSIQMNYVKMVRDDLKAKKEGLKKTGDPALKEQIAALEQYPLAIETVTRVENLRDHVGLIGLTATATSDIGPIPLDNNFAMVGTYHNIVNTLLNNGYIRKINLPLNCTIFLIIALAIGFIVPRLDAKRSIIVSAGSFVALNIVIIVLFAAFNVWIDQLGSSLALLLPTAFISAVKFIREENQKKFIKDAFGVYLSPHVIDQIIDDPDALKLGGEQKELTIFFSDVKGFSSISEKLTPPELVDLMNEYLTPMTDIVMSYDGMVDKYIGDAIMAFYGAPYFFPDHAAKACLATIDMQERLADMRKVWKKQGKAQLYMRCGVNTGLSTVGNMGSRTRMNYTAMGDPVNLASRLEGANKHYGTYAMISENTFEQARDQIEVRHLDRIRVVGKEEPISVFELLGRKGSLPDKIQEMLSLYNEGLENFSQRDWKKARTLFKSALKVIEDDGPSLTYVERTTEFIQNPPSKNWDGVYRMKSK